MIEHKNKYYLTETIGSDSLCNLTLLKTLEKPEKFKYVSFSSNQSVAKVGSFLLGITCALEFEIGPTIGLLQSNESSFGSTLFPTKMLRTSLSLGPGEVGGPVFDLNGNFKSMPEFKEAKDFPRECDNLYKFPLSEWGPFLFAGLNPSFDFKEVLDPINERIGFLPLDQFLFHLEVRLQMIWSSIMLIMAVFLDMKR